MTNRAQDLIKSFYEEEAQRLESEITYEDFPVRLNTSDISMLRTIAKRFGKASDRIASEAISAAIYSMVEALEPSERKSLVKEADELNETLSKKAAKANGKPDFDEKSVTWVMNDRAITREENKLKKEQEEKQKESKPASVASAPVTETKADTPSNETADMKPTEEESSAAATEDKASSHSSMFAS